MRRAVADFMFEAVLLRAGACHFRRYLIRVRSAAMMPRRRQARHLRQRYAQRCDKDAEMMRYAPPCAAPLAAPRAILPTRRYRCLLPYGCRDI